MPSSSTFTSFLRKLAEENKNLPPIPKEAIQTLENNEIDESSFHLLTEDSLKELGFSLGVRLKLLALVKARNSNRKSEDDVAPPVPANTANSTSNPQPAATPTFEMIHSPPLPNPITDLHILKLLSKKPFVESQWIKRPYPEKVHQNFVALYQGIDPWLHANHRCAKCARWSPKIAPDGRFILYTHPTKFCERWAGSPLESCPIEAAAAEEDNLNYVLPVPHGGQNQQNAQNQNLLQEETHQQFESRDSFEPKKTSSSSSSRRRQRE